MTNSNIPFTAGGNQQLLDSLTNDDEAGSMGNRPTNSNPILVPIRQMRLTRNNLRRFRLGETHPYFWSLEPYRGERGIDWIRPPIDQINIHERFSSSVNVYHPYPQESVAEQNIQPHNMPIPTILNRVHHGLVMMNENNRPLIDTRTRVNVMQDVGSFEPTGQVTTHESTTTMAPIEHPYDTEFSIGPNESHSGHQLNTSNEHNAHHSVYENTPMISNDNDSSSASRDQVIVNPSAVARSNPRNVDTYLPNPASCPEAIDAETTVQNPALREAPIIHPLNLLAPKTATPLDSRDESSGESLA